MSNTDLNIESIKKNMDNPFGKFILFMLGWWLLATLSTGYFQPEPKPVKDFFYVCVLEDNAPNILHIKDLKELDSSPIFCQKPYKQAFGVFFLEFNAIDNNHSNQQNTNQEWELKTWTDSMGDPFIYRYEMDDSGNIKPLWYTYGGWMADVSRWFYALIAMAIIWAIGKRLLKTKLVKNVESEQNKSETLANNKEK